MHIEHPASLVTGYLSHNFFVMTSIAQLIKTSEYVCTGRVPVQASAVFLNELIISLSLIILYLFQGQHVEDPQREEGGPRDLLLRGG